MSCSPSCYVSPGSGPVLRRSACWCRPVPGVVAGKVFFFANGVISRNLTGFPSLRPLCAPELPVRKGFSLLELLSVLGLLGVLAALSFPAWRSLLSSGARRTGESRIMDVVEHARSEAISSGREVWVVFRHNGAKGPDADRIMAREGAKVVPLGGWNRLPQGITFHTGSKAIPDALPQRRFWRRLTIQPVCRIPSER